MKFENDIHRETHEKLVEYLDELFESPYHDASTGHFYVSYGSTVLEVANEPYGPEEAVVSITSYCVQGVAVDEELLLGLMALNHSRPFGAFSLVGDDLFFSYSLFGRTLTRSNLLSAIAEVATVADDYDDRIVEKYGGQTALERIEDTGGSRQRRTTAKSAPGA